MDGGLQQSFLVDCKWLDKVINHSAPCRDDVVFVLGGGNGQLASALTETSRIVTVEPDESMANYLYSLELYKNMVIHAEPHKVLGDIPFDKVLCVQPWQLSEDVLQGLLRVQFSHAVMVMPDELISAFRARDTLGTLLRASFDVEVMQKVPKNAYAPELSFTSSLVSLKPSSKQDGVSQSLRLLLQEAGTVRGLLTRSCREFFGYTLADAMEAVRMLDSAMLKKRFWELSEDEFKAVFEWLKLG